LRVASNHFIRATLPLNVMAERAISYAPAPPRARPTAQNAPDVARRL
jgi:hypothetical protein